MTTRIASVATLAAALVAATAVLLLPAASFAADEGRLTLPDFQGLKVKASETVNISLDSWMLRPMSMLIDPNTPDSADMKRLFNEINSIQIRSYQFDADLVYSTADVDAVRKQLAAPGWTPLMQVHSGKDHQDVDIFVMIQNNRTTGLALVASEPRQVTIINVAGSISMDDLPKLENHFHLPKVGALPATL